MNYSLELHVKYAKLHADEHGEFGDPIWFQKYNEKFSELIIRQCARICENKAFSSPFPMKYMECQMSIEALLSK